MYSAVNWDVNGLKFVLSTFGRKRKLYSLITIQYTSVYPNLSGPTHKIRINRGLLYIYYKLSVSYMRVCIFTQEHVWE